MGELGVVEAEGLFAFLYLAASVGHGLMGVLVRCACSVWSAVRFSVQCDEVLLVAGWVC